MQHFFLVISIIWFDIFCYTWLNLKKNLKIISVYSQLFFLLSHVSFSYIITFLNTKLRLIECITTIKNISPSHNCFGYLPIIDMTVLIGKILICVIWKSATLFLFLMKLYQQLYGSGVRRSCYLLQNYVYLFVQIFEVGVTHIVKKHHVTI